MVVLGGALFVLGGVFLQKNTPLLHESVVRLEWESNREFKGPAPSLSEFRASELNDFSRQAGQLRSRRLLSEVVVACRLVKSWSTGDEASALRALMDRTGVEARPREGVIVLWARDREAERSSEIVNAMADRFLSWKESEALAEAKARVIRLESEVKERHRVMASLETRLVGLANEVNASEEEKSELRRQLVSEGYVFRSLEAKHQWAVIEAGEAKTPVHLTERAEADAAQKVVPVFLGLPMLMLLGLLCGGIVTILAERRDLRMLFLAKLQKQLALQVVGFAPLSGSSLLSTGLLSPRVIESYRDLRSKLRRLPARDCLVMTLMPMREREGIAEATTSLACVLADGGETVLVIDADFRQPQLHRFFNAANHPGLADFLSGEMRVEETVVKTLRPNLWFMPSGPLPVDPGCLIAGRRMGDLLWDMRSRFDYLLIVSPSIHEAADAGSLAALADYTTVIAPYREATVTRLKKSRLAIEAASAQLTAVLLTLPRENRAGRSGEAPVPEPRHPMPRP